ncbi:hypothetical protein ACFL1X_01235 [Candidatus Hydrogenedentota bacterium]
MRNAICIAILLTVAVVGPEAKGDTPRFPALKPFNIVKSLPMSEPQWGAKWGDHYLVAAQRSVLVFEKTGSEETDYKQVGMIYPGHDTDIENCHIEGDLIYMGAKDSGLHVYHRQDITKPYPKPVKSYDPEEFIGYISVTSERVYARLHEGGLLALDKKTLKPIATGMRDFTFKKFVARDDGIVYATARESLKIIDASDPADMKVIGELTNTESNSVYHQLKMAGNTLYVAELNGGLGVYDIANPRKPALKYRYQVIGGPISRAGHRAVWPDRMKAVASDGKYAYVAYDRTVDVTRVGAGEMTKVANVFVTKKEGSGLLDPSEIILRENVIAVPTTVGGCRFYDVSDPENPKALLIIDIPSRFEAPVKVGDMVYSTNDVDGVWQFDWEAEGGPRATNRIDLKGLSEDMVLYENHLYIANGHGVGVIDVSDEENPHEVYYWDYPYENPNNKSVAAGWVEGVDQADGLLYVAVGGHQGRANMRIFDLKNPAKPALLSTIWPGTFVHDVTIEPKRKLIAYSGTNRWSLIDVSDPKDPKILSDRAVPTYQEEDGYVRGKATGGNTFSPDGRYLVLCQDRLFSIFDVQDPTTPIFLKSYSLGNGSEKALFHKGYLLVAARWAGISVYKINRPDLTDLVKVQNIPSYFYNSKFFVEGDRIFTNCQGLHELRLVE